MPRVLLKAAVLILVAAALLPITPSAQADGVTQVPLGFSDQFLFNVYQPTAIAFTPDGRMLAASKVGRLFVAQNGVLRSTAALDLFDKMCINVERGLLGVAVDPAFATNHYIYITYTYKKFTGCPIQSATQPVSRISRFVLPDSNIIAPSSEVVLVDNIPSVNGWHNANDVNFGSDSFLYVTVGDAGCGIGEGTGCVKPQATNTLLGKVLRITRDGGIPAGNPFVGTGTIACAKTGVAPAGTKCREIYALGLRNPFRFATDPNGSSRFFINDVGESDWEEIDEGKSGANYGWQIREGHCARGSTQDCGTPPSGMTNPIFDYHHDTGCTSIVGGAFVPNDSGWPSAYLGKYLFADFICGTIFRLDQESSGYAMTPIVTGLGVGSIVHIEFGPKEPRRALYYTSFVNDGEVRRIAFTSEGKPVAAVMASPLTGPTPLTVDFDGSASADPEGDSLTYLWDFGDGATSTTSTPITSHTYTAAGTFQATLVAKDSGGLESEPATVTIVPGNHAPTPVINSPAAGSVFSVGQTLTLSGSASDVEDGTYPGSALTWRVWLHHRDHDHPYYGPASGNSLTITGPAPETLEAATNSYVLIELSVTDSDGITTKVSRTVQPFTVPLTLNTNPKGLYVTVQGLYFTGPSVVTSWAGWKLVIAAPSPQNGYKFVSWSDFKPREHTITTPSVATTYTARFVKV